jgi:hypothetical protein
MRITPDQLAARLAELKVKPRVAARVLRLNPKGADEYTRPRGIHRHHDGREMAWIARLISKGRVIRKYGRAAWESLPKPYKYRYGRRQFARREAVEDRLWMPCPYCAGEKIFDGSDGSIGSYHRVYLTDRYANDPRSNECREIEHRAPPEVTAEVMKRYGHA